MPALNRFVANHPEIRLTVDFDDRFVDLIGGGYDLGVRIGRLQDSALIARKLATSRRVVVCSPAFAQRNERPQTLKELERHPAISYANIRPVDEWLFLAGDRAVSATLRSGMHLNNGEAQREAAIAGHGLAVLPWFIVHEAVSAGDLLALDLDVEPAPDGVYAVFAPQQRMSAKLRAIVDFLAESFGDPPYWDPPFATTPAGRK